VLVVRLMLFPSVSAGGYRADNAAALSSSWAGDRAPIGAPTAAFMRARRR
jgi:hypothetical protein